MKEIQAGFGLAKVPPWVTSLRQAQDFVLCLMEQAVMEGYEVIVLQASTGFGKSLVAYLLAQRLGVTLVYAPPHKPLQDQFCGNFPDSIVLRGRSNYPASDYPNQFPQIHCGICLKGSHCQTGQCQYHQARGEARARIETESDKPVVLNTAYWLATIRYTALHMAPKNLMWRRPLTVIDEADSLEGVLMSALTVSISSALISMVDLPKEHRKPPKRSTPTEPLEDRWWEWLEAFAVALKNRCDDLQHEIAEQGKNVNESLVKTFQSSSRLHQAIRDVDKTWVYSVNNYGTVTLKPIIPAVVSRKFLPNRYPMLLMSATIIDPEQMMRDVGLDGARVKFIEAPAPWDPNRGPILRVCNVKVTKTKKKLPWDEEDDFGNPVQESWPRLVASVMWVLLRHPDERILVHCVSNDLAHALQSKFCTLLGSLRQCVTYESEQAKQNAIARYFDNPGSVLFASSLSRGYDFADWRCRVQVWAKVPWPNLGDPQVRARFQYRDPETGSYDGRHWFESQAIRDLVQGAGRGLRHSKDWCWTYILDDQFERLWGKPRTKKLFPVEFRNRVRPRGNFDDPLTRMLKNGEIERNQEQ